MQLAPAVGLLALLAASASGATDAAGAAGVAPAASQSDFSIDDLFSGDLTALLGLDPEVTPEQMPWLAVVTDDEGHHLALAALIHRQLVVTSAEVLRRARRRSLRVYLAGQLGSSDPGDSLRVRRAAGHPDFDRDSLYHDVAILQLEGAAPVGAAAVPLQLQFAATATAGCRTVYSDSGASAQVLRQRSVRLVEASTCEADFRRTVSETFGLHPSFTCAKVNDGDEAACKWDKGAPLTCTDPADPERTVLVGLYIWSAGCRADNQPTPDLYSLLSDTETSSWLDSVVFDWLRISLSQTVQQSLL